MTRLAAALGVDGAQWWALTRTYLLMDLRRSGGPRRAGSRQTRASAAPFATLLVAAGLNSLVVALLVFVLRDTLTAALLMVTMVGMTIAMLLLVDFVGAVMSAEDYWVIAPRPVSSRTYFAARFAAVLAYVVSIAGIMSAAPAVVFAWRHALGPGGVAGALLAGVLAAVAAASLVIAVYTHLLARLAPGRLVGIMSWVHLAGTGLSMAGFLLMMRGFEDARIRDASVGDLAWIWYAPPAWFAALVPALGGVGDARIALGAAIAVALTPVLLWLSAGALSIEVAATLSEAKNARGGGARGGGVRIPGFGEGEAYAVATLIRAQFRHDLRFRLGVLGVVPMTLFYLAMGWDEGALADPFAPGEASGAALIYMPLAFLPMILHGALQYSEHWRASWIFWSAPADPARLVIAAKNFVGLFFIGGYVLFVGSIWALFYERVWHAAVHAAIVGAGAHMLLQVVVTLGPSLPFSKEPTRAEQSGRLTGLFFTAALASAVVPPLLPFVYARPAALTALVAAILAGTYALERRLHRRARAYAGELEFV
jgi:hypothetical protein